MTPELARAALAFLGRAQIQGAEAPTFMQVCAALDAVAKPTAEEKPQPTAGAGTKGGK